MPTDDVVQRMIDKLMFGNDLTLGEAREVAKALAPSQARILVASLLTGVPEGQRRQVAYAIDIAASYPPMD